MLIAAHPSQGAGISQPDHPASFAPAHKSEASGSLAREAHSSPPAALAMVLAQGNTEKYLPALHRQHHCFSRISQVTWEVATPFFCAWFPILQPPKAPFSFETYCLYGLKLRGHFNVILGTVIVPVASTSRNQDEMYFHAAWSDFQGFMSGEEGVRKLTKLS